MKLLLIILGVVAAGAAAITITPSSHDYGQTRVPSGLSFGQFAVSSTPGDSLFVSVTGPNAGDFQDYPPSRVCLNANYLPATTCPINVNFRPGSLGIKTATLVVTNRRGQRATASLRGEGVKGLACQPILVMCNYVKLYTGSIQVRIVDSVATSDHQVRNEDDLNIAVANGVVTCSGLRTVREMHGYKGKFDREVKGTGPIAGSGMLAIEFDLDQGRPVYVLTYACPTPRMTTTSTDLNSGNSDTETFPGAPADWRDSERLADPQPSTGQGMTPLTGRQTNTRYEPENHAGGFTMAVWDLKQP